MAKSAKPKSACVPADHMYVQYTCIHTREYISVPLFLCLCVYEYDSVLLVLHLKSCPLSALLLPGLGTVQWSSN